MTFPDIDGYRITKRLGEGGFGSVFLADSDLWDEPQVAVKVLRSRDSIRADEIDRFAREGRIGRSLHHPNILPVYGVGNWRETAYIVMKHVKGGSWGSARTSTEADRTLTYKLGDPPPKSTGRVQEVLSIAEQIADALEFAHGHGIVHRDVKSSNILVEEDGHAYLADFGLAKQYVDPTTALTVTGALLGSPPYMPPEAISGRTHLVDQRSDIYSLGVTTFEMCSGRLPFTGDSLEALRREILDREPPRLSDSVREAPAGLDEVLGKALEKDRRHRYQSASEFREDLVRVQRSERPLVGKASALVRREARRVRRHRAPLAMGVVMVAVFLAGLGWFRADRVRDELDVLAVTSRWDQAELFLATGQFTPAKSLLEETIELQPESPEPCLRMAAAYASYGYTLKQEELVEQAIGRGFDPTSAAKTAREELHLGLYHCARNEFEEAARALERCLQRDPECYEAYVPLYRIYLRLRELDRARDLMQHYLGDLKPRNPRAVVMRAQLLEFDLDFEAAWELLTELESLPYEQRTDLRLDSHLGRAALRTNRLDDAERYLEAAVHVHAEDGSSWVNLGLVRLKRYAAGRGDLESIYHCARRAIACDPLLEPAYQLLTYDNKNFDEAQSALQAAGGDGWRQPRLARLQSWRLAYEGNRLYDEAEGIADRQRSLEQRATALRMFESSIALNPKEVVSLYALAQNQWVREQNLEAARGFFERASDARREAEIAFDSAWVEDTVIWSFNALVPNNHLGIEVGLFATASQTGADDRAEAAHAEVRRLLDATYDYDPEVVFNFVEALTVTAPEAWRDCPTALILIDRFRLEAIQDAYVEGVLEKAAELCR